MKAKINFWRLTFYTIGDFEVIPEADCATEGRKGRCACFRRAQPFPPLSGVRLCDAFP